MGMVSVGGKGRFDEIMVKDYLSTQKQLKNCKIGHRKVTRQF